MSTPSQPSTIDPSMDPNFDPNAMDPNMDPNMMGASEADAVEPSNYRKQDLNIYTVMLVISFVCLVVAIILLIVELSRWGDLGSMPYSTRSAVPNVNWIGFPSW